MKVVKLNQNRDFRRAYAKGKYAAHPLIVTYVIKNRTGETRIGITASKKVGNAVQRNRARRIIVAAFVPLQEKIKKGYDIVLVARTKTPLAKSTAIAPVLQKHLQRLGLIENDQKMDAVDDPAVPEISV
ncbi:MAG: ribonuclease P protein component [Oscillospiraceae bacterium]|nr:ribonuclease P protein component [Oscillospiraceae bacterium]